MNRRLNDIFIQLAKQTGLKQVEIGKICHCKRQTVVKNMNYQRDISINELDYLLEYMGYSLIIYKNKPIK